MAALPKQTTRAELIDRFRRLGFTGPVNEGGKHYDFMRKGKVKLKIPNVHDGDIRQTLLGQLLSQAGVTSDEWKAAGDKKYKA